MKQFLILFCFLVEVFGTNEAVEGCSPWPSNVRSLRECCNVPQHSCSNIQNICTLKCFSTNDEDKDCPINCYLNQTLLIKNESIDKTIAKSIYKKNIYFEHKWKKFIDEGVDKCEYVASDSVTQSLLKFYDCVNEYLADNCVSFQQSSGCEEAEDLFDKCQIVPTNCTDWPMNMFSPESCCKSPKLFSESFRDKCRVECSRKELFMTSQLECVNNCTDAVIKIDNKIDFDLVKKLLMENSKENEAWEKPIANAVEECKKVMDGLEASKKVHGMSDQILMVHLFQCLNQQLSEECVEFQSEKYCKKVKNFMSRCPDTKLTKRTRAYANVNVNINMGK